MQALVATQIKPYYEESGIVIYNARCEEVLPFLPKVDLLVTDPPYGLKQSRASGRPPIERGRTNLARRGDYGDSTWDDAPAPCWLLNWLRATSRYQVIFGGNYFDLPPAKCWLVWDKDNEGSSFADCELAWTNLDKAVRRLRWRWNGMLQEEMGNKEYREHPTQKPIAVMKWAISQAPQDCETVLDPFMGSGSTIRAAKDLGKKAIGIECEERYAEIAANRLRQEVLQF